MGAAFVGLQLHRPLVARRLLDRRADRVGERLPGHRDRRHVDLLRVALDLERGDSGAAEQVDARQAGDAVLVGRRWPGQGRRRLAGRPWRRGGAPAGDVAEGMTHAPAESAEAQERELRRRAFLRMGRQVSQFASSGKRGQLSGRPARRSGLGYGPRS